MRVWNLEIGSRFKLPLAADSRFCEPDYTNDQIWELVVGEGDPLALAVQTTYGLRAHWHRIFPRFIYKDVDLTNPAHFYESPRIQSLFPNHITLHFSPFKGIEVNAGYWIPSSQVITGKIQIINQNNSIESIHLELVNLLSPLDDKGEGTAVIPMKTTHIVKGKTGNLEPVCFVTGSPKPGLGPYPALALNLEILPGNSRSLVWAQAALGNVEASFNLAKQTANRNWDAEIARVELLNSAQMVEIYTGNPDWDCALTTSQRTAFSLFFPKSKFLNHPSFVLDRQMDNGHPLREDGSDYPFSWNGQSPLDAYYLTDLILPGGSGLAEGVLRNFLEVQRDDGTIDWRPGLAGQQSRLMATPILATLALKIDTHKSDHNLLCELYPALLKFFKSWFRPELDQDCDFFPEWQHPIQAGLEENPLFDLWNPQTQGLEIRYLESPALASLLFLECRSLIKIAQLIQKEQDLLWLKDIQQKLEAAVENSYSHVDKIYHYRDFESHLTLKGIPLVEFKGSGMIPVRWASEQPCRLQIHLFTIGDNTRPASFQIFGETGRKEIHETINPRSFTWVHGHAYATSRNLFTKVKEIQVFGLGNIDQSWLSTVDHFHKDCSLLLPLFSEIPSPERAREIVDNTLQKFVGDYGLSISPVRKQDNDSSVLSPISSLWSHLIIHGLLVYGYRSLAADLLKRWMDAFRLPQLHLNPSGEFFVLPSQLAGKVHSLYRLAPIGLYLEVLGVQITDQYIIISGDNPFNQPQTIKYRGISITRHIQDTVITYPSGQTVTVEGNGPHHISLV